jgi:hypothetical protein
MSAVEMGDSLERADVAKVPLWLTTRGALVRARE